MTNKTEIQKQIVKAVETVKQTNPMAGSITNTVTINFVANAQLAVGGSAAMVYLPDEAEALALAGGAFYINVGTLFPIYEQTLPRAAKVLHEAGKPWVLDPVAIGIGSLRTNLLKQFREFKPSIIRGNASEIIALAGLWELGRRNRAVECARRGLDGLRDRRTSSGCCSRPMDGRSRRRIRHDGFYHGRFRCGPFPRRFSFDGADHRLRLFARRRCRSLCYCRFTVHRGAYRLGRVQPGGQTR